MPKIIAKKQDWINLGYKLFSEQGITGIVVEKMAKKLKVNKSSFYWHFKTKKDFIIELVDYWVITEPEQIIKSSNNKNSAEQKIETLITIAYKKMPYLDFIFYLKRYAQKDKKTQTIIDKIDNQRIEYVEGLLKELNYSEEEAKIKSSILYKHLIGYHEMIRYKKQNKNYFQEVTKELSQFIKY